MSLEQLREASKSIYEMSQAYSEKIGQIRNDALVFSFANIDDYRQNQQIIEDHFNNLQRSCVEDDMGRNCIQQASLKMMQNFVESSNTYWASMSNMLTLQSMYIGKRMQQKLEADYFAQQARPSEEFYEAMENEQPTLLNPARE